MVVGVQGGQLLTELIRLQGPRELLGTYLRDQGIYHVLLQPTIPDLLQICLLQNALIFC